MITHFFEYEKYFKDEFPICMCLTCYNNLGNGKKRNATLCEGTNCIGVCSEKYKGMKIIKDGITFITVNPYYKYKYYKPNSILLKLIESKEFFKKEEFLIE
jgi:hypothetical protein